MKSFHLKSIIAFFFFLCAIEGNAQKDFQGRAFYYSKTNMDLGEWGARMSEAQKNQMAARLKNRLQKTYILTFNREESLYNEDDKLGVDAVSGATDTWGKNFSPGEQYKNIKNNSLVQNQEFYGKRFLVKDELLNVEWKMGSQTKQIGGYTCYQATAMVPSKKLAWYDFSWNELRNAGENEEVEMTEITAWYTPEIPVSLGPAEFHGLPGLILETNINNTTLLCFKVVMNPEDKINIEAPDKGKVVSKEEYKNIISEKMQEMRDNRGRPRGSR